MINDKELKQLVAIAMESMVSLEGRGDLERRYNGEEDFYDSIAVWEIKAALIKAYELGKESR